MVFSRSRLKGAYFMLLAICGKDASLLRKIRSQGLVVVLNLHQVSPHANPFWSPLHPHIFEDLLNFLKRHFDVTCFQDRSSSDSERPKAILSFDDGYYDFVEYAMPLLHKHGLRANQNIIPSCVESGRPPWNTRLCDFLNSAPRALINELHLPGFPYRLAGSDNDSKTKYGVALSRFLKTRPRGERQPLWSAVETLMEKVGDGNVTRMMNLEDVREASRTHEVGAHSFSHDSMEFESDDFFEEDLDSCVDFFAQRLHLPISIYAFPNGSYRQEHIEILRKRGIQHILLVDEKFATRHGSVYPRFTMYGESSRETRFRALGYHSRGVQKELDLRQMPDCAYEG